jgi:hypothetical protein
MAAPTEQGSTTWAETQDKSNVVIKSRTRGADGWEVQFGENAAFRDPIVFKNVDPPRRVERSFQLIGKKTLFCFRDGMIKAVHNAKKGKMLDVRCSALISIQLDDCTVLQNSEKTEDSSTWIISFELKGEKSFVVAKASREPSNATFPQIEVSEDNVPLWKKRLDVQRMKCMRFILPNYKDCGAFKPRIVQAILLRELEQQSWQSYKEFIALQRRALKADDDLLEEKLDGLKRERVNVQVDQNANSADLVVSAWLPGGGSWKLEAGQNIHFESEYFQPNTAPAPFNPADEEAGGWTMSVERQERGRAVGRFNNQLSPELIEDLTSRRDFQDVKATVSEKDPEALKLSGAIDKLELRFMIENGEAVDDEVDPDLLAEIKSLKIPVTRKLLEKFRDDFGTDGEDKPLVLANKQTAFSLNAFASAGRPIEEERQVLFLQRYVEGYRGLTVCQGPPGTGKTTLLASLTALILGQGKLGTDKIVLTAHSNVAVEVLVEKTAHIVRTVFNKNPEDFICHVLTPSSAKRIKASGRPISPEVAALSLDRLTDLYVERRGANTAWGQAYVNGRDELREYGRISGADERKEYYNALRFIYKAVRAKFAVFACTLSTTSHALFVGDKVQNLRPKCEVLIMDEASQATTPYEVLALFNLNPRRLVIAGDHLLLSPYTSSGSAQVAWKRSWLQRIIERGFDRVVRLNVQYRSPREIGNSISVVHYEGDVKPHHSCNNRPRVTELRQAVARISFQVKDTVYRLSHNVHFFDIKYGKVFKGGEDSSSSNKEEVNFIRGLVWCLVQVGITEESIMALTGYQAQFEMLDEIRQVLPAGKMAARKIDSSQGDERDVVIVSTVKTGTELGFMSKSNRQNVGCSRARNALFIVGQGSCLYQDPKIWTRYLDQQRLDQGTAKGNWRITIRAPVSEWFIDDKPTVLFSASSAPPPPPPPSAALPPPPPSPPPPSPIPEQAENPAIETSPPPPSPSPVPEQAQQPAPIVNLPSSAPASSATNWDALLRPHLLQLTNMGGAVRSWGLNTLRPVLEVAWAQDPEMVPVEMLSVARGCPVPLTVEQLFHMQEYFRLTWLRLQEQRESDWKAIPPPRL